MSRHLPVSVAIAGAVLIAIVLAGGAASAADTGGRGKPASSIPAGVPSAGQSTPGGGSAGPLKGVIRLGPGSVRAIVTPVIPAVGIDQLAKKFDAFSAGAKSYETSAATMLHATKTCAGKAYTVQDQQAAGCTGSESLNQCMEKLYKHCVLTYYVREGGAHNPTFSAKLFQQKTATTAAEARALSQMLTQYANEVEQKAKALVP